MEVLDSNHRIGSSSTIIIFSDLCLWSFRSIANINDNVCNILGIVDNLIYDELSWDPIQKNRDTCSLTRYSRSHRRRLNKKDLIYSDSVG